MNHNIQCKHLTENVPVSEVLSDYYPLLLTDVIHLLRRAKEVEGAELSSIQCRLAQGIKGIVCPHELDGPVAEATCDVEIVFMEWVNNGKRESVERVARRLVKVMKVWVDEAD